MKAIKNVNEQFSNIEDIFFRGKNTFSTSNQLSNQIRKAVDAEKLEVGSGTIDFVDASILESVASAPVSFGAPYLVGFPLGAIALAEVEALTQVLVIVLVLHLHNKVSLVKDH